MDLDINVHGAPNFRSPRQGNLNVFGVAQPRTQGLRGILSVLRCRPNATDPTQVVWFCTREEPIGMSILLTLSSYNAHIANHKIHDIPTPTCQTIINTNNNCITSY